LQAEVSGPVTGCWATCVPRAHIYSLNIETHARVARGADARPSFYVSSLSLSLAAATVAADVEQSTQVLDACRFLYGRVRARSRLRHTTTTTTLLRVYTYLYNMLASLLFLWAAPVAIWHSPNTLTCTRVCIVYIIYVYVSNCFITGETVMNGVYPVCVFVYYYYYMW